ncbi:hypothetical protein [Microbacterium sp. 77mftsu3.1]|uniref:hypothetical protein n=1 Tax=Microbacterium sp. 77mftsu3.1 TaxID=1761802 RepID=UPI00036C07F4|nr:hypothetical protein [Microbacterium sp. 77mftsu3.1]SDH54210.1 hypothetical protein SAMN04488590_3524 [Microbacterium sp. 77mftsu3.1]
MAAPDPYDRVVHGYTADGHPIVRYERAGKWYVEPEGEKRQHIVLSEAARLAAAGRHIPHQAGGKLFNARVAQVRA